MLSLPTLPLVALDNIIDNLPYEDKLVMRLVSRQFRDLIPPRITIKVTQLANTLHIDASFAEGPMTEQFLAKHEHEISSTKRVIPEKGMMRCVRSFAFPPTCKYSFFASAKIEKLKMCENFPISLNNENWENLTNLISGCTIKKISLVFDKATAANLIKVPALASSVRAEAVDFALTRMRYNAATWDVAFASKLVNAGVREVSFSGQPIDGFNNHPFRQEFLSFNILLNLFTAGVESITVNAKALFEGEIVDSTLREWIDNLANLGQPLRLKLFVRMSEYRPMTNPPRINGVIIDISKAITTRKYVDKAFDLITIECNGMKN